MAQNVYPDGQTRPAMFKCLKPIYNKCLTRNINFE